MPVLSAAQVRAVLTGAVSADDTLIGTLIDRVDVALHLHLGWPVPDSGTRTLGAATYTLYPDARAIDVDEPAVLHLGLRPVVSVTSVHVDANRGYGAAYAIAADYRDLDAAQGLVILRDTSPLTWSTALRANRVIVSAGWATLPGDLAHAAILQVGHWLAHSRAAGRVTVDDGQARVDLAALDLLPEVRALVRGYRLSLP